MDKILEELYFGNISPHEKQFDGDSDYRKLVQLISKNENKLTELLADKQKMLFLDYVNAQNELNATSTMEALPTDFGWAQESCWRFCSPASSHFTDTF